MRGSDTCRREETSQHPGMAAGPIITGIMSTIAVIRGAIFPGLCYNVYLG